MTYKAVIFDFNGTLLWDTKYHNQAWDQFLDNHNIKLSDEEKAMKIHGKPNSDIFKGLFNGSLTSKEIEEMSQEKEQIYRNICSELQLELAPGAREFIDFLKSKGVDYAIATSSGKENVDFYLQKMNLSEWINPENIIYDDGSFKGKPHPDIFLKALQKIGHKS
jgi:beta-phosphoglucomutase